MRSAYLNYRETASYCNGQPRQIGDFDRVYRFGNTLFLPDSSQYN